LRGGSCQREIPAEPNTSRIEPRQNRTVRFIPIPGGRPLRAKMEGGPKAATPIGGLRSEEDER